MTNSIDMVPCFDEILADFIVRLEEQKNQALENATKTALTQAVIRLSAACREGHTCLSLSQLQVLGEKTDWSGLLNSCVTVGTPGAYKPLILDPQNRLYLQRFWSYEEKITAQILARSTATYPVAELLPLIGKYFPADNSQRSAALSALQKDLCIISGGPGTGKTSTAIRILLILLESGQYERPQIILTAPTGKAAARLLDALAIHSSDLAPQLKSALPDTAFTVHRLLAQLTWSKNHSFTDPDLVILDEASMMDVALFSELLSLLPKTCRLIILGDKDQLASVEPGSVLGDICRSCAEQEGLICLLKDNFRFSAQSGIRVLSDCVLNGDLAQLERLWNQPPADLIWRDTDTIKDFKQSLKERVLAGFNRYFQSSTVADRFSCLNEFSLMCATRKGPRGLENLNLFATEILKVAGLIDPYERWYVGLPVIITKNNYDLQLYNGDIGITGNGEVFFQQNDGTLRSIAAIKINDAEPVYAMSVHKSQGSEFARILLILPETDSAIMTSELLYTAVTRARQSIEIWCSFKTLKTLIQNKTSRETGLSAKLSAGFFQRNH